MYFWFIKIFEMSIPNLLRVLGECSARTRMGIYIYFISILRYKNAAGSSGNLGTNVRLESITLNKLTLNIILGPYTQVNHHML